MRRLLLAGGGHAHLEVLRRLIETPIPGVETTLVSGSSYHHYSGMVPGYLAGIYQESQIAFDLKAISQRAGVQFLEDTVVALTPEARQLRTDSGIVLDYDLVSLNLGSEAAGSHRPEFSAAEGVKPISRAVRLRRRLLEACRTNQTVHVVVVGAGAAGYEVACATRRLILEQQRQPSVHLIEASGRILQDYSPRFRRKGVQILERLGIETHVNQKVARVTESAVLTELEATYPAQVTVWLTGAAASSLLEESGLAVSGNGFLLVDDHLRSISNPLVLAVGDCATLVNYPQTPKAGVYSVRQAPILWQTIQASLLGQEGMRFEPQAGFLSILNTCDGRALLRYQGLVSAGRWAWWLKDWIDRRFMRKYQSLVD